MPELKEIIVCVFSWSGITCEVLIRDQDLVMISFDEALVMLGFEEANQAWETQPRVLEIAGSS